MTLELLLFLVGLALHLWGAWALFYNDSVAPKLMFAGCVFILLWAGVSIGTSRAAKQQTLDRCVAAYSDIYKDSVHAKVMADNECRRRR